LTGWPDTSMRARGTSFFGSDHLMHDPNPWLMNYCRH
jgi:hypothetical protein